MKDYETILEVVENALEDNTTYHLALLVTDEVEPESIIKIVTELYYHEINRYENFNVSVQQYLFGLLNKPFDSFRLRLPSAFDNEEKAKNNGYVWGESINRWIKYI